jgi:serine protease Do
MQTISRKPLPLMVHAVLSLTAVVWPGEPLFAQASPAAATSPLELLEQSLVDVIQSSEKSIVAISRSRRRSAPVFGDPNFDPIPNRDGPDDRDEFDRGGGVPNDFGAGVIIRNDGLILTNFHLVKGGPVLGEQKKPSESLLSVRLANRQLYFATILAADPRSDLAVIKIPVNGTLAEPVRPARLYNGDPLRKGQLVIGFGNAHAIGRDGSASAALGMVSNVTRTPGRASDAMFDPDAGTTKSIHHLGTLLHVDMRLSLGTSGGSLVNPKGELVGITTPLAAIEGYERSAGFAVPIDARTLRVIRSLEEGMEVEYGFLGVALQDVLSLEAAAIVQRLARGGAAEIKQVQRNTPAERGGLRDGDVVLKLNGNPVLSDRDLMRQVGLIAPGTMVELRVCRPDEAELIDPPKERTLTIEVGKWPADDEENIIAPVRRYQPWRGLVVDYPTARQRFMPFPDRRTEIPRAVLITERLPGSPAERAELQVGDFISHVDDQSVQTPKEFYTIIKEKTAGSVRLTVVGTPPRTITLAP